MLVGGLLDGELGDTGKELLQSTTKCHIYHTARRPILSGFVELCFDLVGDELGSHRVEVNHGGTTQQFRTSPYGLEDNVVSLFVQQADLIEAGVDFSPHS